MKKEPNLKNEDLKYWKKNFLYGDEGEFTFEEWFNGTAGSGPDIDAQLGFWGGYTEEHREIEKMPEEEQNSLRDFRYQYFKEKLAEYMGLTYEELKDMTSEQYLSLNINN